MFGIPSSNHNNSCTRTMQMAGDIKTFMQFDYVHLEHVLISSQYCPDIADGGS